MTTEDWKYIAVNAGAGGLVLAGILLAVKWWIMPMLVKVVAPMIVGAFDNLTKAIHEGATLQAEALRGQAAAMKEQSDALGRVSTRLARVEARLDLSDDTPPPAVGTHHERAALIRAERTRP